MKTDNQSETQSEEPAESLMFRLAKRKKNDYSEGVQKRIAKLTRKMREAERQKEEAIQYAQQIKTQAEKIKIKV